MCFKRKYKVKETGPPQEVKEAFKKYTEGGNQMTVEQLTRFLVEFQGESGASISDAGQIVEQLLQKRYAVGTKYTKKYTLTLDDLHRYLFSTDLNPPIGDQVLLLLSFLLLISLFCSFGSELLMEKNLDFEKMCHIKRLV